MRPAISLVVALALTCPAVALAKGTIVYAGGSWAAIDRGDACVALGRSARIAAKGKVQATAGFSFARDRRGWGEFHARWRRRSHAKWFKAVAVIGATVPQESKGSLVPAPHISLPSRSRWLEASAGCLVLVSGIVVRDADTHE